MLRVGWHLSRGWDWCMPEDDKKETEKLWKDREDVYTSSLCLCHCAIYLQCSRFVCCDYQWQALNPRQGSVQGTGTKTADIVKHLCSQENYAQKCQFTELVSETNLMNWPRTQERRTIPSIKRKCMSFYFLVDSQKQKTLGCTAVT